jgi:hypothetical protein
LDKYDGIKLFVWESECMKRVDMVSSFNGWKGFWWLGIFLKSYVGNPKYFYDVVLEKIKYILNQF